VLESTTGVHRSVHDLKRPWIYDILNILQLDFGLFVVSSIAQLVIFICYLLSSFLNECCCGTHEQHLKLWMSHNDSMLADTMRHGGNILLLELTEFIYSVMYWIVINMGGAWTMDSIDQVFYGTHHCDGHIMHIKRKYCNA
jgi:hypothetical protein